MADNFGKDPADWVQAREQAGLTPEQIYAEWQTLTERAQPIVAWWLTQQMAANPDPDASTLKAWFAPLRELHNKMTDEFLKRELRQILAIFFKLDEQQLVGMLRDGQMRQQAPVKPEAPLPAATVIEVELLRRLYTDYELREWFIDREKLLFLWEDDVRRELALALISCVSDSDIREAAAAGFDGRFEPPIREWLIGLDFLAPLPDSTEFLIARHYNLTLPARRSALSKEYQQTKDATALQAIKDLKPLPLEAYAQ